MDIFLFYKNVIELIFFYRNLAKNFDQKTTFGYPQRPVFGQVLNSKYSLFDGFWMRCSECSFSLSDLFFRIKISLDNKTLIQFTDSNHNSNRPATSWLIVIFLIQIGGSYCHILWSAAVSTGYTWWTTVKSVKPQVFRLLVLFCIFKNATESHFKTLKSTWNLVTSFFSITLLELAMDIWRRWNSLHTLTDLTYASEKYRDSSS